MYLPALARDLYKSQQEVQALEQRLQGESPVAEQEALLDSLRQAKAELGQIRNILEGHKEQSRASLNKPRFVF